jgi:hypothetical protein
MRQVRSSALSNSGDLAGWKAEREDRTGAIGPVRGVDLATMGQRDLAGDR